MKFNLTHINVKAKEQEKEQQRQYTRIADLTTRTAQNDIVVKQEINKELTNIKANLDDLIKRQEATKQKLDKTEGRQDEMDKNVKQKQAE